MNQRFEALFGAHRRLTPAEFDQLFLEYHPRIVAVAFRLTGDPAEADDLAAEAFLKLWQDPPAKMENLAGWLYRVVIHLGYNRLRSNRRRLTHEERNFRLELVENGAGEPEDQLLRTQERTMVREILRAMPRRDVQLLIMRAAGLSYKEIAAVLRLSPAGIGTLLARAEKKFTSLFTRREHAPER